MKGRRRGAQPVTRNRRQEPQQGGASTRPRGARRRLRPGAATRFGVWLRQHAQAAVGSLGRLCRAPGSSLMTVGVVGIALALPTGFGVLLDNLQAATGGWDRATQISLFLEDTVDDAALDGLADRILERPGVMEVATISREQALEEFKAVSGFGDALAALPENPLPPVLVVLPDRSSLGSADIENLVSELGALAEVEMAQLDMEWLERLYALLEIGERMVLVVGTLLALAVLLVVGNTVRLEILNRREEIEVAKLIGGTDGFIRRPFLYAGLWYGLLGTAIAWLLVQTAAWMLAGPADRLAGLYDGAFALQALDVRGTAALLAIGCLLGLLGSWLAVGRHLRAIEPA